MAWLTPQPQNGEVIELTDDPLRIGRSEDNDLVLASDGRASRHHAEIERRQDGWWVHDLGSRNGTWVNAAPVQEARLQDGDLLQVGTSEFRFAGLIDPNMTEDYVPDKQAEPPPALSPREREILALLADGATDEKIAATLFLSTATVRSHLDRIRDKTGCRRRPELTRLALSLGLHP